VLQTPTIDRLITRVNGTASEQGLELLLNVIDAASITRLEVHRECLSVKASDFPQLKNVRELVLNCKRNWLTSGPILLTHYPALSSLVFVQETSWFDTEDDIMADCALLRSFVDTICHAPASLHDITLLLSYDVQADIYDDLQALFVPQFAAFDWASLAKAVTTHGETWTTVKIRIDFLLNDFTQRLVKTKLDCAKLEEALRKQVISSFSFSQYARDILVFVVTVNASDYTRLENLLW